MISDVQAKQAQVARKFAKMSVCNKLPDSRHLQSFFTKLLVLFPQWINVNFDVASDAEIEIHGFSVYQDQIDLWMRDAARFDDVLYRGLFP